MIKLNEENMIVTIDEKPLLAKDYKILENEFKEEKSLAIVMQGPIKYEHNFTVETLKIYKQNFKNCPIIVSTWDYEKEETLNEIENLGCIVIRNKLPEIKSNNNTNYQIKSTKTGLQKAKELGFEYVIKTRTDQRMYESHIPEYMFNLLKTFPLKEEIKNQKQRLVSLSLNTFKYRLYDISDMFLFGHIDDVINFWSMEYDDGKPFPEFETVREYCKLQPCEIGFTIKYLNKLGENLDFTLRNSWEMYAKYFIVVDSTTVGLLWPKYTDRIFRWRNFSGQLDLHEELTFKEWFNMYSDLDNIIPNEDILERTYYGGKSTIVKYTKLQVIKRKVIKFLIELIPNKKIRNKLKKKHNLHNKN